MNEASAPIDLLGDARRALLAAIKHAGRATIPRLAETLSVSTEAVRQQLAYLQRNGWVIADCGPDGEDDDRVPGRPAAEYCLTPVADDLFPKDYTGIAVLLFDEVGDPTGTLAAIADRQVERLGPSLGKEPFERWTAALRSIYREDDPYTQVEHSERGHRLIERNCPYLRLAKERPVLCSASVSALRRATGREVVREQRFQDGEGRCVFQIYADAPIGKTRRSRRFELEPAKDFRPKRSAE
jgi:predicted ArsR family transcriptional regulator